MKLTREELVKLFRDVAGDVLTERWQEVSAKAQEANRQHTVEPPAKVEKPKKLKGYRFDDVGDQSVDARSRKAARCIRYMAAMGPGGHDLDEMIKFADREGDVEVAEAYRNAKALGVGTIAAGGALVPPEFASGIIELLDATTVFRKAGPLQLPMNTGSLTLPYINTGASASYTGEGANITKSEPTFGQLQLRDHKLAALVPVGNDLLRNGGAVADNAIRTDVVRSIGAKEDSTFIGSDGSAGEPKGLRYWCQSTHKFNASAASLANATANIGKALRLMQQDNVDMMSTKIFFAPRTEWYLKTVLDSNGNAPFKAEMANGLLFGFPFFTTSRIAINEGSGTDESVIYFANMQDVVLAQNEALMVEVFPGGTYYDGSSLVSGISQDQTVIRAISLHDLGCRFRGYEVAVIEDCKWGA